jgi:hypothetical protein
MVFPQLLHFQVLSGISGVLIVDMIGLLSFGLVEQFFSFFQAGPAPLRISALALAVFKIVVVCGGRRLRPDFGRSTHRL